MKIFSVIMGVSRIEFSMWQVHGGYEARINDSVMYRGTDWETVRGTVMDSLQTNHVYMGMTH